MKKAKKKVKAPKDADTFNRACDLKTDNVTYCNFWILTDGYNISMAEQKMGESATQEISIQKKIFDRLIRWYETGKPPRQN